MGERVDLLTPRAPKRDRVTAADVRLALMRRFCEPQHALLFEVGDATGGRHTRRADALAMGLWPSQGLYLHGMEIKVSRYDWRQERARPEKAETIAAYCDRWSLVTGPGVVESADEIPAAWGWLHFDGERLVTQREATITPAKDCDRRFLAALLRRASKTDDATMEAEVARRVEAQEKRFEERVASAVNDRLRRRDDALKDIEAFEAAAGFKISEYRGFNHEAERTGRAVAAVLASGVDQTYGGLRKTAEALRTSADKIEAAMADLNIAPPKEEPTSFLGRRRTR